MLSSWKEFHFGEGIPHMHTEPCTLVQLLQLLLLLLLLLLLRAYDEND